jgi:aminopeptidase-like protein
VAKDELELLDGIFDRLFLLCRSITGQGLRDSLDILGEFIPLARESISSGTAVFDWVIPPEWKISGATLKGPDGRTYADFAQTNLAVVNYSGPIRRSLSLAELQPHLHSIPSLPEATPYVTSYYQRTWGFCLPESLRSTMPEGTYEAWIDSEHFEGQLDFAHAVLPGESTDEVLISSYLCHPSLANNELSGPLVLTLLYRRLSEWKRRRFTYRFVLAPETIGSLAFLSRYGEQLTRTMVSGLVLTCLGGRNQSLSYKSSRTEDSLLDRLVGARHDRGIRIRKFTPTGGSDERQFCSPGFNLPVGQFARDVYGEYDGYHNSGDTKEFMGIDQLVRSADDIEELLAELEYSGPFRNLQPFGEPQLGRRGLYPNLNCEDTRHNSNDATTDRREFLNSILWVLNYSDGNTDMLEIAKRFGSTPARLRQAIDALERESLLSYSSRRL